MSVSRFFLQVAYTESSGWVLALRSNDSANLESISENLKTIGFRKSKRGNYVLVGMDSDKNGILLPEGLKSLLSENSHTAFQSTERWLPWVEMKEQQVRFTKFKKTPTSRPVVLVHGSENAAVQYGHILKDVGFSISPSGVVYLTTPEGHGFESHSEMVAELSLRARALSVRLGGTENEAVVTLRSLSEVSNKNIPLQYPTFFEIPSLSINNRNNESVKPVVNPFLEDFNNIENSAVVASGNAGKTLFKTEWNVNLGGIPPVVTTVENGKLIELSVYVSNPEVTEFNVLEVYRFNRQGHLISAVTDYPNIGQLELSMESAVLQWSAMLDSVKKCIGKGRLVTLNDGSTSELLLSEYQGYNPPNLEFAINDDFEELTKGLNLKTVKSFISNEEEITELSRAINESISINLFGEEVYVDTDGKQYVESVTGEKEYFNPDDTAAANAVRFLSMEPNTSAPTTIVMATAVGFANNKQYNGVKDVIYNGGAMPDEVGKIVALSNEFSIANAMTMDVALPKTAPRDEILSSLYNFVVEHVRSSEIEHGAEWVLNTYGNNILTNKVVDTPKLSLDKTSTIDSKTLFERIKTQFDNEQAELELSVQGSTSALSVVINTFEHLVKKMVTSDVLSDDVLADYPNLYQYLEQLESTNRLPLTKEDQDYFLEELSAMQPKIENLGLFKASELKVKSKLNIEDAAKAEKKSELKPLQQKETNSNQIAGGIALIEEAVKKEGLNLVWLDPVQNKDEIEKLSARVNAERAARISHPNSAEFFYAHITNVGAAAMLTSDLKYINKYGGVMDDHDILLGHTENPQNIGTAVAWAAVWCTGKDQSGKSIFKHEHSNGEVVSWPLTIGNFHIAREFFDSTKGADNWSDAVEYVNPSKYDENSFSLKIKSVLGRYQYRCYSPYGRELIKGDVADLSEAVILDVNNKIDASKKNAQEIVNNIVKSFEKSGFEPEESLSTWLATPDLWNDYTFVSDLPEAGYLLATIGDLDGFISGRPVTVSVKQVGDDDESMWSKLISDFEIDNPSDVFEKLNGLSLISPEKSHQPKGTYSNPYEYDLSYANFVELEHDIVKDVLDEVSGLPEGSRRFVIINRTENNSTISKIFSAVVSNEEGKAVVLRKPSPEDKVSLTDADIDDLYNDHIRANLVIATPKPVNAQEKAVVEAETKPSHSMPNGSLENQVGEFVLKSISAKAFVVMGDTRPHKNKLNKDGARGLFKPAFDGWMFPKTRLEEILVVVEGMNASISKETTVNLEGSSDDRRTGERDDNALENISSGEDSPFNEGRRDREIEGDSLSRSGISTDGNGTVDGKRGFADGSRNASEGLVSNFNSGDLSSERGALEQNPSILSAKFVPAGTDWKDSPGEDFFNRGHLPALAGAVVIGKGYLHGNHLVNFAYKEKSNELILVKSTTKGLVNVLGINIDGKILIADENGVRGKYVTSNIITQEKISIAPSRGGVTSTLNSYIDDENIDYKIAKEIDLEDISFDPWSFNLESELFSKEDKSVNFFTNEREVFEEKLTGSASVEMLSDIKAGKSFHEYISNNFNSVGAAVLQGSPLFNYAISPNGFIRYLANELNDQYETLMAGYIVESVGKPEQWLLKRAIDLGASQKNENDQVIKAYHLQEKIENFKASKDQTSKIITPVNIRVGQGKFLAMDVDAFTGDSYLSERNIDNNADLDSFFSKTLLNLEGAIPSNIADSLFTEKNLDLYPSLVGLSKLHEDASKSNPTGIISEASFFESEAFIEPEKNLNPIPIAMGTPVINGGIVGEVVDVSKNFEAGEISNAIRLLSGNPKNDSLAEIVSWSGGVSKVLSSAIADKLNKRPKDVFDQVNKLVKSSNLGSFVDSEKVAWLVEILPSHLKTAMARDWILSAIQKAAETLSSDFAHEEYLQSIEKRLGDIKEVAVRRVEQAKTSAGDIEQSEYLIADINYLISEKEELIEAVEGLKALEDKKSDFTRLGKDMWATVNDKSEELGLFENRDIRNDAVNLARVNAGGRITSLIEEFASISENLSNIVTAATNDLGGDEFKIKGTYPLGLNYEKKFSKPFLDSVNAIFSKMNITNADAADEGIISLVLTDPNYDSGGGFATNELGFGLDGEIVYCTEFYMEGHRRTDGETFNIQFDQGTVESQGRRDPITADRDFPGLALGNIGSYLSMGVYEVRVSGREPKLYLGDPNEPLGDIPEEIQLEDNPLTSWVENYDEHAIAKKLAAHDAGDKTEILTAEIQNGSNQLHLLESATSHNLTIAVMSEEGVISELKVVSYEAAFGLNKTVADSLRNLVEGNIYRRFSIAPRPTSVLQKLPSMILIREKSIIESTTSSPSETGAYENYSVGRMDGGEINDNDDIQRVIIRPRKPILLTSEQGVINIQQLEAVLGASAADSIKESLGDDVAENGDIKTDKLIKDISFYGNVFLDKKHDALVVNNIDNENNPVFVVPFSKDSIYQIPSLSKVRETEKQKDEEIEILAREIVKTTTNETLEKIVSHLMNTWAASVESGVSTNKHLDAFLLAQSALDFREAIRTSGLIEGKDINYLQAGILGLIKDGVHPKHIDSHVMSYGWKGPSIADAFHGLARSGYITSSDSEIFNYKAGEGQSLLTDKAEELLDLLPVESVFWHLETISKYDALLANESSKKVSEELITRVLSDQPASDPLADFEKDEVSRIDNLNPIQEIIETEIFGADRPNRYAPVNREVEISIDPSVIEEVLFNFDDDDIAELRDYIENHNYAAIRLVQAYDEFAFLEEPIVKTIYQASKAFSSIEAGKYTLNDIVDISVANWALGESGSLFQGNNESDVFIPSTSEAYIAIKEVMISHLMGHEFLKAFDSSQKAIDIGLGPDYKLSTMNVLTANNIHTFESKEGKLIIVKNANNNIKAAAFLNGSGRISATALKEYKENQGEEKKLEINVGLNKKLLSAFTTELNDLAGIKHPTELDLPLDEFLLSSDGYDENDADKKQNPSPVPSDSAPVTNNVKDIEKGMAGGITQVALFKRNVAAIETLKDLETSGRKATSGERTILAGYAGWGGIVAAFQRPNGTYSVGWEKRAKELETLLSNEEYISAKSSTNSSFYTNADMIKPMYEGLERMGVAAGQRWLEPSVGTGNFFGLMPPALERDSFRVGIELDSISSRIADTLYSNNSTKIIKEMGYQNYNLDQNRFDVVVGNPPFGDIKLYDALNSQYNGMTIHNYFINKSLMGTRVGGVMAVVVSRYLMDKASPQDRMEVAKQADLVGAFRLPKTAFKSSNTEAVADVLFFQRHDRYKELEGSDEFEYPSWVESSKLDVFDEKENEMAKIPVNNYFHENPNNVIGNFSIEDGMIKRGLTVLPPVGRLWEIVLSEAIKTLPENIYENKELASLTVGKKTFNDYDEELIVGLDNLPSKVLNQAPEGLFYDSRYGVLRKEHDVDGEPSASIVSTKMLSNGKMTEMKGKDLERLVKLVKLREVLDDLLLSEQQESEGALKPEELRKELNNSYTSFVAKFGYVNNSANKGVFRQDPSWVRVSALEDYSPAISDKKALSSNNLARPETAKKMAIFTKRLFIPGENILKASTPIEALVLSLSTKGKIDIEMMSNLIKMPKEELINELEGEMFLDPANLEWTHKDIYLSGNVKAKAKIAERESFDNPIFANNAEHLKRIFPTDIPAEDIIVGIGASWLPQDIYADFIKSLAGQELDVHVRYIEPKAEWIFRGAMNPALKQNFSTEKNTIYRTLSRMASNNPLNCYVTLEDGKRVIDAQETESVNQIATNISKHWNEWLLSDQSRLDRIAKIYNETINVSIDSIIKAPASFEIVGKVPDSVIELRRHQKDYVWRCILKKDNSAIHDTGAGKTFAEVAAILTKRRLGISRKPILAVPNHLTGSWTRAFYALYPHAKILSPAKSDFLKENRQKLFAKIATGDWDCVIIAHSQLERLPIDHDMAKTFIEEEITNITESIGNTDKDDYISTKRLEALKLKLHEKLQKIIITANRDKGISWKMLNCDSLSVDESHNYKNLGFATSLTVSGLGSTSGSNKAFDYFIKAQSIRRNGGRVSDLTATPISNTIAEMYTYLRFKAPERLKEMGLSHFDAWVRQFAEVTNEYELDATGVKYRLNQRLSKFKNVPELMTLYREVSHIVTTEQIKADYDDRGEKWIIPKLVGGKPKNVVVPRTSLMADYMFDIVQRASDVEEGIVDKTEDNKLKITTDARKAALDMRLIDDTYADDEETKVDFALREVVDTYHQWDDQKGTQLIFCDLGVPKSAKGEEKIILVDLIEKAKSDEISISDKATKQLEKYSFDEIDSIMSNNNFSVYDYIRNELVEKYQIPSHEIAFIHDAKTDDARVQLFDDMNSGLKRVLIGSTRKMGEGMNVQERLVWQHELDCPWRPDQVQQRRGRIDRQGNKIFEANPDFEIGISRYATEKTYDSRMWQTVETKARFIGQLRSGYVSDRIVDDITPEAAGAAEMKAASSGNPDILREFILRKEIKDAEAELREVARKSNQYKRDLQTYKRDADHSSLQINIYNDAISVLSAYPDKVEVKESGKIKKVSALNFSAEGRETLHTAKDTASAVLIDIARKLKDYKNNIDVDFDLGKVNGCRLGFDWFILKEKEANITIQIFDNQGKLVNQTRIRDVHETGTTGMATILRNLVDPEYLVLNAKREAKKLDYYNKSVSEMESIGEPETPSAIIAKVDDLRAEHTELLKTVLSGAGSITATTKDIENAFNKMSAIRTLQLDYSKKFINSYDAATNFLKQVYPLVEGFESGKNIEEKVLPSLEDIENKIKRLEVTANLELRKVTVKDVTESHTSELENNSLQIDDNDVAQMEVQQRSSEAPRF